MSLGPHGGFIIASYAITLCVVGLLIAWVALDHRRQRQRLRELGLSRTGDER